MAEVLVVGKKISEMDLVTDIVGDEKIPTGVVGDKAVTTGQLLTYVNNNGVAQWGRIGGDITNQIDLQNQFTQERDTLKSYTQDQVSQQQAALQEHIDATSEVFEYARENGSALPYKEGVSYEEGAVVVKDGMLQQWKGGDWRSAVAEGLSDTIQTFNTSEEGVDPVTGVAVSAYFNVRSTEDDTMLVEYQNVGGVATATGKSYPSGTALNAVKEAIIDPTTGRAMASKVFGTDGENLEDFKVSTKTYLDNFPFYIPFSQSVPDYAPQFKTALESGRPIILTQDAVYPFLTKVDATVTKGVQITGNFATLSYEGASHIGDFISIKGSTPLKHYFYSLNVDGKHKATRVFYVEATQSNSVGLSYAYFNNCHAKRAKRSTEFVSIGGNGISVRGAFSAVDLEYSKVSDCMLGTGAGIVGSVGISGLSVTNLNSTAFPHELNLNGFTVEKIYSEDPDYIDDQDGIVFFGADGLIEKSVANITALSATNCWGRSIKTQCRVTNVIGGTFTRTEGNATKVGSGEIDYQMGVGFVKGATFRYFNGYQPGAVLSMSAHSSIPRSSYTAEDCDVYLDGNTTLDCFIRTFPRTSKLGLITAKNCKIYGKAINFASLRYRGDRNIFEVQGCYVAQIVADPLLDNQLNFIAVRSSGSVSGETNTVEINLFNNINDGSEAYLVRDGISGSSMITTQNGRGNAGFVDVGTISGSGGQKSLVPLRATAFAGKDSSVSYSNTAANIPAGNTVQLTLPRNTQLMGVQVRGYAATGCLISHGTGGAILSQIGTGSVVYSNGTTEPTEQGTWLTIWRDATDSNKINIKNNNTSNRFVAVHCFTA